MKAIWPCALLIINALTGFSQDRPLGTWRGFPSFQRCADLADAGDRVYAAGETALFSSLKADGTISLLDKVNGISDVRIRRIGWNENNRVLVIAYQNANIDLLFNHTDLYNLPELKNKILSSTKNINNIAFSGRYAYLSTDIGILEIQLDRKEIGNNYVIGNNGLNTPVYDLSFSDSLLFAATGQGVKQAPRFGANLLDFSNWTLSAGLPVKAASFTEAFNGNIFAVIQDSLFVRQNGVWQLLRHDAGWKFKSLDATQGLLSAAQIRDTVDGEYRVTDRRILQLNSSLNITTLPLSGTDRLLRAIPEQTGDYWVADSARGLQQYRNNLQEWESIIPDGPRNCNPFRIETNGQDIYTANVPFNNNGSLTYNPDGISRFTNGKWTQFTRDNTATFSSFPGLIHANSVRHDAARNITYIGSFGGLGIIDENTGNISFFNHQNSPLLLSLDDPGFGNAKIAAMCLDSRGNLWMNNFQTNRSLAVRSPEGNWYNMVIPKLTGIYNQLTTDDFGQVWAAASEGVVVADPGEDLTDPSDDRWKLLTTANGNGGLPNNRCQSIVKDKNGDIWVGTNEGIAVFYCPGSVFSSNGCDADLIKVERDGFVDFLFKTERVRALAVDGANRKWVGTENGVWLISADGKEELVQFNTANSPLPSNTIYDIALAENGEVFIATAQGLVSYMGDARFGGAEPENVLVFPNPVEPDYSGPIAIRGLVDDAYVKITNASGQLCYQGKANGGQMIWDGNDYNGNRAASGVYLVYSSTLEGKQRYVAKLTLLSRN